jgi:predicted dehydrogenase
LIRRVGIVGLGAAAAGIHIPALRKLDRLEIVGGYDLVASSTSFDIPLYASVEDLIARAKPDLLVVATPPASHYDLARIGLAAGCHVFCEKPLTETLAQARRLSAIAAEVGKYVFVNSEFPWMPIHSSAKLAISDPSFGPLLFVSMHQTFVVTDATERGWRGKELQRTFKEFGTHVIDLACFFFGELPCAVRARMPKPAGPDSPDLLNIVQLEFSGDRCALIVLDRLSKGRHRYLDIRLDGKDATVETSIGGRMRVSGGVNPRCRRPFLDLDLALGGRARLYRGERFSTLARAPLNIFADATARLLSDALVAIAAGRPPPNALPGAEGILEIMLACYESASSGERRELPPRTSQGAT